MQHLKLNQLIYGMTNIMIISKGASYKEAIEEIELIKSGSTIDGFIFRPGFTNTVELTEYTAEDWQAMYAQYSLTYGWSAVFAANEGTTAQSVLDKYFRGADKDRTWKMEGDTPTPFQIEDDPGAYYLKVATNIASSKLVLRSHQKEIVALLPEEAMLQVIDTIPFVIKDTKVMFIARLMNSDSYEFSDPQELIKFLVSEFSDFEADVNLNRSIAKIIRFKLPTSMKKSVYKQLNNMRTASAIIRMKPQVQLWKRLFAHIRFDTKAKMEKRFPTAAKIKQRLYDGKIRTPRTGIEFFKREGKLLEAFELEMQNPGQMIRSLLFYLRYTTGMEYAKKNMPERIPHAGISGYFGDKTLTGPVKVVTDITDILQSGKLRVALRRTNTKLLWQMIDLIKDKRWASPMSSRVCNKKHVSYAKSLPALNIAFAQKAVEIIKQTIQDVKHEANKDLGKVYIDKACKDFKIQFSGREDTSISMSGAYLTPGSKIPLKEMLEKADDNVIRIGIAWRGRSCDVDLSMNIIGKRPVYYGNPTLAIDGEVLLASSGDITSCGTSKFSTEFIDIDVTKAKKAGLSKMFSSAIMFSGPNFDQIECYWFIQVIPKNQRARDGRSVQIALDEMDYAVKLQAPAQAMLGLLINLEKEHVEVLNTQIEGNRNYHNAEMSTELFEEIMAARPKMSSIYKVLKNSFYPHQLVKSPHEADIVISPSEDMPDVEHEKTILNPGVDAVELQKLYF